MGRVARVVGIVLAALIVVAIALPFFIDANQFRPRLETELSGALGRSVKLGDLKLSLWSGAVKAANLSISDDPAFSMNPFLMAQSLSVGVDLPAFVFSKKLVVTGMDIEKPEIALLQNAAGNWNFSSLSAKSSGAPPPSSSSTGSTSLDLSVKLLKVSDARISLTRGSDPPQTLDKVNLELRDFAPTTPFPFSFSATIQGGGDISLTGKAGPINAESVAATPFTANLKVDKLDIVHSGFVRAATGFAGLVSVTGTLNSDGKDFDVQGDVKADQLKLAKNGMPAKVPVDVNFVLHHDTAAHRGSLTKGDVRIGTAKASLTGTYQLEGPRAALNVKLNAPAMQVQELTAILPALAVQLPRGSSLQGGTLSANFAVIGPADQLDIKGTLAVKGTRLANFNLGSQMTSVAKLAGINMSPNTDFENISADAHSNAQGVDLQNISVVATNIGDISGAGTVSPTDALNFKMHAKLKTNAVMSTFASNVPFSIEGSATDPKFVPDIKGMAAQELKSLTAAPADVGKAAGDVGKAATGVLNIFKKKTN